MKKFISYFMILCIVLSVCVIPQTAFGATNINDGALGLLSYLNIMSGDPDGNMRLDDAVSRAEFSKMAVTASSYKNSVASSLAFSPFPDVTYKHWAAPYVKVAVSGGIVSGYPNGTFEPETTVLYEEAVTMMLRVLGYKDEDFGNSWPSGQLGIAENIDLTDDIDCVAGDVMTRRDVAKLVYNALKTELKDLSTELSVAVFDVRISEDAALIATHSEDTTIASDSILTSEGTYKLDIELNRDYVGMKGDIAVKNNKKLVGFIPDGDSRATEEYIVYSTFDNKVLAYKNGSITQLDVNDGIKVYNGTAQTTFGMIKQSVELGDKIRVKRLEAGDIDYITYTEGNLLGPVTAMGSNWQSLWQTPADVSITRDGASVSASAIKSYDILYYLPDMNMVMAYSNKVTGIYETAEPNRDAPTSIIVSGKSYKIECSNAFNKIHSGGEFEYGDTVTLLLGKDGEVADVISPSATVENVVGYVIGTGIKEYNSGNVDTFKNYYIKVVQPDGNTYEYVTDRDYSESLNSIGKIDFSNGYARIVDVSTSSVGGTFNWSSKKFGSDKVSSSVNILDIGTRDNSIGSMYAKVYGQRLDGLSIAEKNVLYAEKNSSGEIITLILDNVTGDAYEYGLVVSTMSTASTKSYTYMVDGNRYTTTTSGNYSIGRGVAVKIMGRAESPNSLNKIESVSGKPTMVSSNKIAIAGNTYELSDKVACYKDESSLEAEYSMISIYDVIEKYSDCKITAYYDKTIKSGGRVRVLVVSE